MTAVALSTDDDLIVLDPQGEYAPLIRALGGEVIRLGPSTGNHINPFDMSEDYNGRENPIAFKSDFVLSLVEQAVGAGTLTAKEKSIIDRVTAATYKGFIQRGMHPEETPTLVNFGANLGKQLEDEAKGLALSLELYIKGSLNTFARPTNVNTSNRIICYDIRDLGKNLQAVGMLVVLDAIMNRISQNFAKGKRTWVAIDEITVLFANQHSSHYMDTLWRQVRKFGGLITGMTQNVSTLLESQTARDMLSNSEFIVMLNQAALDRGELAKLLGISETQLSYITNPDEGRGLLRCGSSIVPFEDKFPKDTQLYRLMTTKPDEQKQYRQTAS
jgi:type IV secretory pathway VirB4 component